MVTVELYGKYAELAGGVISVDVALPITLSELSAALSAQHPMLAEALAHPRTRFCVNDAVVLDEIAVQAGDTVALFPPVSGG